MCVDLRFIQPPLDFRNQAAIEAVVNCLPLEYRGTDPVRAHALLRL